MQAPDERLIFGVEFDRLLFFVFHNSSFLGDSMKTTIVLASLLVLLSCDKGPVEAPLPFAEPLITGFWLAKLYAIDSISFFISSGDSPTVGIGRYWNNLGWVAACSVVSLGKYPDVEFSIFILRPNRTVFAEWGFVGNWTSEKTIEGIHRDYQPVR